MNMKEDQASGEPPPEAMDQSDEASTSGTEKSMTTTKSLSDRRKQMIARKKIEQYFQLVTKGCNRPNCENPNCASNPKSPKISGNEAAVKAIQLLRQKAEICPMNMDGTAVGESTSNHSADDGNSMSQPGNRSDEEMSVTQNEEVDNQSQMTEVAESTDKEEPKSEKTKNLKVYRVQGVKYLTEEMIDDLIAKCEEDCALQDSESSENTFKKNPHKDPYNALFITLTEIFSDMDNLNRSFLKKTKTNSESSTSIQCEESMDIDSNVKNEVDSIVMSDEADSAASADQNVSLSSALTSFFSSEFPNSSYTGRSNAVKKKPSASKVKETTFKISVSQPTVDVESIRRVYKKLQGFERANDAFVKSLHPLCQNVNAHLNILKQLPGSLDLNLFIIVMENPMLHSPEYFECALPEFCKVLSELPLEATVELVKWWSKYSQDELRTFVECFQQLLTVKVIEARLYQSDDADIINLHKHVEVANAVKCLKIFYHASLYGGKIEKEGGGYLSKSLANSFDFPADDFDTDKKVWQDPLAEALGISEIDVVEPKLPLEEFQNHVLNESISVYNDFTSSVDYEPVERFTFMKYPFVLNIVNKTTFFFYDSKVQMLSGRRLMILQSILSHAPVSPYLRLKIRRDHVIADALVRLELIASDSPMDLRKQLYVEFEGEQGVDEGGVSKEFFQLVVEQIFNPDYGMFTFNEDTRLFWFNPHSFESSAQFTLIGIVLGLAIYNNCILDIKFPAVVFKKLLGKKPTFDDLKQSHPSIYNSLASLLDYEGSVEEDLLAVFSVEYHGMFDETRKHELKENGENIPVTNANRKEFVDLYMSWLLNDSIKSQFEAFRHGFDLVVAKSPLKYLFRSDELDVLISGSQEYDFKSLEDATEYDSGFTKDSDTVKDFWAVVHNMTEDDKKRLLQFTTGTDRAPVGGLAQLKLVIAKNGPNSNRLPTAHTCFNVILLPDYRDREKLKERLYKAITYAKGFGML